MKFFVALFATALALPTLAETPKPGFGLDDLARLADVAEPQFSPDGNTIVYSVSTVNVAADRSQSDLWRVSFDGRQRMQLTFTPDSSEWRPQFSADGRSLAFLSDRGGDEATTQVWIMAAQGGEARKLTAFPGGVEDFVWSPDSQRLAVIVPDPELPPGAEKPKNLPPIITERYQFKNDEDGFLGTRHKHLYLYDIATGKSEVLTSGLHDEQLPAWSPDGGLIAYVTKRGADPDRTLNYDIYVIEPHAGASERQLTTFPGSDLDPYWETRPAWSPNSKQIAYLQSGEDHWIYYAPWQLAVVDVTSGKASIPAPIDRCFYKPHWAPDGKSIYALIEQKQVTHLSRIDLASGQVRDVDTGDRFDFDLDVAANGRIVVLGGTDVRPYELSAVDAKGLRALSDHNAFLDDRRLATAENIRFKSADGTEIEGLLLKPIDYQPGKRYPTILRIHGGPAYQFSHEFMVDWQYYVAQGYVVVASNPRGSTGRGFDFSRAIYADWGNKDVQDVLAAVDYAVSIGIADPQRLGVGGRSYGSILTNYVIASDPRFKAAVSGSGTSNMFAMYGDDEYIREYELELGTPWKNYDAYARVSYPFLHADRIHTPTQFYCAQIDFNVPCIGAEQMYQALRSLNVPTQLVLYPGEHHGMVVPSYLRDRLERSGVWYGQFLKK
jgi:dipeptidyl aminopeptidase/acylaminoacyl peptidase